MPKFIVADGITLYTQALPDADTFFTQIKAEIKGALVQKTLPFRGKQYPEPRLTAYYGDPGTDYTYSGVTNVPMTWTPTLQALRERLNERLKINLNACLINAYRDGQDRIAWHSDNEPEIKDRIVSVSLGGTRTLMLRDHHGYHDDIKLDHGSVFVMTRASQDVYQHCVPQETGAKPRLNLTFRVVAH